MNQLIDYFGRKGLFADLVTVAILVIGIGAIFKIQREAFPNISWDVIMVQTSYPGASSEEAERLITNPLEQDLKEVNGIKRMTSISREGSSLIMLQLDVDQTTLDEAEGDIQDVVDRFSDLPEGAKDPVVTSLESGLQPVIEASIAGDLSEEQLRAAAKRLEIEIESIPEVARVNFSGLRDFEIRVEAIPQKLRQFHISLNDLIMALQRQNLSIPAGVMEAVKPDDTEIIIRTVGEFKTALDVENTVIRANEMARAIRVRDVAKVTRTFVKKTEIVRTNSHPAINLVVLKKENSDLIKLVDQLKAKIEEIKPSLDSKIEISYINDISYFVRRRLSVLSNNLVIGLVLVAIFLSLILPWRVAIVTAFGIPFSFLGTMILFQTSGISLSLISMMGLIIVVGMLVDDAVVVTENTTRLIQEGENPTDAAIKGTQQVWLPVLASVATTVVAFLPLMFMSGIIGKFIKFIPMGVVIALLISLYECFFILPHHMAKWIKPGKRWGNGKTSLSSKILGFTEMIWDHYMAPLYLTILEKTLRFRYLVVLAVFVTIGLTAYIVKTHMKMVLFPPGMVEFFQINIKTPVGTRLEETLKRIEPIEQAISQLPKSELNDYVTKVGIQRADQNDPAPKMGSDYAQIFVYLTPAQERKRSALEIIEGLRAQVGKPKGLETLHFARAAAGPPTGKPVNIGVRARDYEDMQQAVSKIKDYVSKLEGVSDLSDNFMPGKKEFRLKIAGDEAAAAGLTVLDIGNTVRAAYEGLVATTIRELDEEIDVRVSLPQSEKSDASGLSQVLIPNARGYLVPLDRVAQIESSRGIASYEHEDNQRQIRITGEIDTDVSSATFVAHKVEAQLPELLKGQPGVRVSLLGENQDTQESMQTLRTAFLLALFGIALILVLTFGNLIQPLLILLTIPLGLLSTVWTFFFHGMPFTFLGLLGTVALGGVIVNNAIVFMDFVNKSREEGMEARKSILEAGRVRIRPIFLTSLTTTCGILPTAYGWGGLDPFVVPIALALGWGVLFGSVLTTIVFPSFVAILDDVMGLFSKGATRSEVR